MTVQRPQWPGATTLNRIWRLWGTALSFTVFGLGGVLMTLFVFPFVRLLIWDTGRRRQITQRLISRGFALFIEMMRRLGVLSYEVTGLERLHRPGCLVIANHPTLIDVVFLISLMPQVDCIVKRSLWRNPVTGAPVRAAGYISNVDGPQLVRDCRERLDRRHQLIIFPEGTRTRPGQPLSFQRGAANVAIHAAADLIPVTILCNQTTLTKGQPWYHVPPRKVHIRISVDAHMPVQPYLHQYRNNTIAARKLTEDLRNYYLQRLSISEDFQESLGSITRRTLHEMDEEQQL